MFGRYAVALGLDMQIYNLPSCHVHVICEVYHNHNVLLGDDTDLLVLLCYNAEMDAQNILFKPEPKQRSKT